MFEYIACSYVYPNKAISNRFFIREDEYTYKAHGEFLTVSRNGIEKTVKVERSGDYVYRLYKTKIKAIDGAQGVEKFLLRELDGPMECYAHRLLDFVIDSMKPAKTR